MRDFCRWWWKRELRKGKPRRKEQVPRRRWMAWARHPIPQLRLHGADSQATPRPAPSWTGPPPCRGLPCCFPGKRSKDGVCLHCHCTREPWLQSTRKIFILCHSLTIRRNSGHAKMRSCATTLSVHPKCGFQFCFSLHFCAWQCQHVLRRRLIASPCKRHG